MDIISMIMSQNRGDGEPIAYTEPGKKYTWDGDISNTEVNDSMGMPVYKISSDIIDPYKVSKVTLYISGQGEFVQDNKQFEIVDRTAEVGMYIITLGFSTGAGNILISVGGDNAIAPVGIYLSYVEDNGVVAYISGIELAETIHPIDPKYIPDSVKTKIIDLDSFGITEQVLGLLMNGGGSTDIDIDHNAFWKSIPADGAYKVKFVDASRLAVCIAPTYTQHIPESETPGEIVPKALQLDIRLGEQSGLVLNFTVKITAPDVRWAENEGFTFHKTSITVTPVGGTT